MSSKKFEAVRRIFQAAVELPEKERAAFILKECAEDPALQDDVERLLKFHIPDKPLLHEDHGKVAETQAVSADSGTKTKIFARTESFNAEALPVEPRQSPTPPRLQKLQRRVLLLGLLSLAGLMGLGAWVHYSIRNWVVADLQDTMQSMLDQQVCAVETWLEAETRTVESWASSPDIVTAVQGLLEIADENENAASKLVNTPVRTDLQTAFQGLAKIDNRYAYAVWNREGALVADSAEEFQASVGNGTTEYGAVLLHRVFQGETVLWLPSIRGFITKGLVPSESFKPGLCLITPVYGEGKAPIAAMLIADTQMQDQFETLLAQTRFGTSGETYAIGEGGYFLSESRFLKQLQNAGLVPDRKEAWTRQVIRAVDPGRPILGMEADEDEIARWPLTHAAAEALASRSGSNFTGYRNYRGVEVVGVWTWLPDHRFALLAEVDLSTASNALRPLDKAFFLILSILAIGTLLSILGWLILLRKKDDEKNLGRIGAYTLRAQIGEGGFAKVYLANHRLLRRPTAVKVLKQNQMTQQNLRRFEREVQLASALTHQHTIRIYDYGATEGGEFYYAMEYIEGVTLYELVELDGPLPPERVIWILKMICRSLREAHSAGLVHRDIKPQNIMLCCRGGEYDIVKVLDFGLARNLERSDTPNLTETKLLVGTPLYIAPERIIDPTLMDARSDIFSLGVLGYMLLTGKEPFDAADSYDALAQTVKQPAKRPSAECPVQLNPTLDELVHRCQLRDPDERPQSITDVLQQLNDIKVAKPWNDDLAAAWWTKNGELVQELSAATSSVVQETIQQALGS